MAPLAVRLASARAAARHPRIRASSIESALGTRFAADTMRALRRRSPDARFVWLMGADILPELHRWHDWRRFARTVAIAIVPRPGYDNASSRAMVWLKRFCRPAAEAAHWTRLSLPAIITLDLPRSGQSATAIRRADPDWSRRWKGIHR